MRLEISLASGQSLLRKFKAGFPDAPHIRKEGDGINFNVTNDAATRWLESTVTDDAGLNGIVFAKAKIGINRFTVHIEAPVSVAQAKEIYDWLHSKKSGKPPYTTVDSPKNTVRAYSRKSK